jgi:hypothetical protein
MAVECYCTCEIFPDKMPEIMMRHGFFKGVVPNTELQDAAWEGVQL